MECGLLGRTLGHSYSPQIHRHLGDYRYRLFEREPEELENFLKNGSFSGLNVTIPYKQAVLPYLDQLTPEARRLGNVNTIVRRADGSLLGHNTDYFGFASLLDRSGLEIGGKKVLALGTGGASHTVQAVLRDRGARVVVISRSGENNYGNLDRHADAALIVNATPVGMYPHVEEQTVTLEKFPHLEGVLDLIYNPARTKILMDAENRGLVAMNGLWMLVAQAWESAQWFTGSSLPEEKIPEIHRLLRLQMENILLIGMPGCGKTTVGKLLAEKTGKTFVDADAELEHRFGVSIPDVIHRQGEPAFRELESQTLGELGKQSGLVVATGGGCVTREENYPLLHRNGRLILLDRALERLSTAGRPLSQRDGVQELYRVRRPLYQRFADGVVDNNGAPREAVSQILEILEEL